MPRNKLIRCRYVVLMAMAITWASTAVAQDRNGGESVAGAAADTALSGTYLADSPSRLILLPDMRFEWLIADDRGEQTLRGAWQGSGGKVTVTPDERDPDKAMFAIVGTGPWNDDAQDAANSDEATIGFVKAFTACPFARTLSDGILGLAMNTAAEAPAGMTPVGVRQIEEQRKRLADATGEAVRAQGALEAAIRVAMGTIATTRKSAPSAPGIATRQRALAVADERSRQYLVAKQAEITAYGQARQALPDDEPLDFNLMDCAGEMPATQASEGLAVHVIDTPTGYTVNHVKVGFLFTDGERIERTIDSGWAAVRPSKGQQVRSIVLTWPYGPAAPVELPLTMASGVVTVDMDARLALPLPFARMQFTVEGADLVSRERGWRYQRIGDAGDLDRR